MGEYYRALKTKRLLRLLVKYGFVAKIGAKHGKYCNDNNLTIIVPRHRVLSPGVAKEVCDFLEQKVWVTEEELKKLFK